MANFVPVEFLIWLTCEDVLFAALILSSTVLQVTCLRIRSFSVILFLSSVFGAFYL